MRSLGAVARDLGQGRWDGRLEAWYGAEGVEPGRERIALLLGEMHRRFGDKEVLVLGAPGRTELGGNHTDHNNGRVLAAAVHLDCLAVVAPRPDARAVIHSQGFARAIELVLDDLAPRKEEQGTPEAIVRGVAAGLAKAGVAPGGFEACVGATVPVGSGLSSSAAFEVLMAATLDHLHGRGATTPQDLALVAKAAENEYFGKPCGFMDQLASAEQGVLRMDFREPGVPEVARLDADMERLGHKLVVVTTGGSHADLTEEYAAIPREMLRVAALLGKRNARQLDWKEVLDDLPRIRREAGDRAVLRVLHFLEENERVLAMAEALVQGRADEYLRLVRASGDSSWRLLQNCVLRTDPAHQPIPLALTLSRRLLEDTGAWRVHGGGFAGTIQAYVPGERFKAYVRGMEQVFGPGAVIELRIRRPAGFLLWDAP